MARNTLYPLADHYDPTKNGGRFAHVKPRFLRALATGEMRPPKKGEWYLSGAIVEAYQAPNDLTQSFHIAEIVEVEIITQGVEIIRTVEYIRIKTL